MYLHFGAHIGLRAIKNKSVKYAQCQERLQIHNININKEQLINET